MAKDLSVQMADILDECSQDVVEAFDDALNKTMRESVQKLKSESPKQSGEYASGWKLKKEKEGGKVITGTVYNAKKPGLTHLLENGHVIRNKSGTFGRVGGRKHIEPVQEWAETELTQEIMKEL